jgi:hypothetical protein
MAERKGIEICKKLMDELDKCRSFACFTGFHIALNPLELMTLHGAIILASKHPGITDETFLHLMKVLDKIEDVFLRFITKDEVKVLRGE